MALYKKSAHQRAQNEQVVLEQHYQRAQQVARLAAALLKAHFSLERVAAFGSLVHKTLFHSRSDIDLAAWGLDERDYYRAVGELQAIDPEFAIDLVRIEDTPPALRAVIEQDGVTL